MHAHPAFGASAFLYLEPESIEWKRFPGREASRLAPCPSTSNCVPRSLVDSLIGKSSSPGDRGDTLVAHTCTLIRTSLDGPITLAALAKAVHLSPSRLAHRFREATGVPLRRYVLWCRLRTAADSAMHGSSLTEAAHLAGFADSAHLTRTFRAMFGFAPSLLFTPGRTAVSFCESAARS